MNSISFSAVLGPGGEQRIELIERTVEINPAPLHIDARFFDVTLAAFYEVNTDAIETGQVETNGSGEHKNKNRSGQRPETSGGDSLLTGKEERHG